MLTFDPRFIDATDWQILPWYNSGGTRAKRVLQDDDGMLWYFKCSERKSARDGKPEKHYKYEFWSEVIAYQIGHALGIDILRYDVALHNGELGCISPLMIDQEKEQLVEIGRYMTVLNPDFNPSDRKTHGEYSFEFLIETLDYFNQGNYLNHFLKTIVFDALIGNTDRHQENWAFIASSTSISIISSDKAKISHEPGVSRLFNLIQDGRNFFIKRRKNDVIEEGKINQLRSQNVIKMAPIYDSGSSLGRELSEERIVKMLANDEELERYIEYGKSELHWQKNKISHLEMIGNLLSSAYLEQLLNAASFLQEFSEQNAVTLVLSIDAKVPSAYSDYCLTSSRKRFIIKLLTLRSQKLKVIIGDGRV